MDLRSSCAILLAACITDAWDPQYQCRGTKQSIALRLTMLMTILTESEGGKNCAAGMLC